MTTQQQPTPYDAEIAELERRDDSLEHGNKWVCIKVHDLKVQRYGFLAAKAEDADLLAACKAALDVLNPGRSEDWSDPERVIRQLRAAIAKARGELA